MSIDKIKTLLIEDDLVDQKAFVRFVREQQLPYDYVLAGSVKEAREILNLHRFDIILIDYELGDGTAFEIFPDIQNDVPIIIITGNGDEEIAVQAMKKGATDYLIKDQDSHYLKTLQITVNNSIKAKRTEAENKKYRLHHEAIFRSVQEGIITVDNELQIIEANQAARTICGIDDHIVSSKKGYDQIGKDCNSSCLRVLGEILKSKTMIKGFRIECQRREQPNQIVELTGSPLLNHSAEFIGAVLVTRDITRIIKLERELKGRDHFHRIIGQSSKMQGLYRIIEDLAETDTTVLITGETGTGKELVAEALHYSSQRATGPLVRVNCGALSEFLLESEIFGHVKGAFTGAVSNKIGRFELASGGSIFLDEIGDISPQLQLKLLRVIQEKIFERVGDSRPTKVDVRIIAATNNDLKEKMAQGVFREDLYYRLKVVELKLPPLSERAMDIPLLIEHFRMNFNKKLDKSIGGLSSTAMSLLTSYPWPGNIRELQHTIEHAFILCHGDTITEEHLPAETKDHTASTSQEKRVSRKELLMALDQSMGKKAKAARLLGISRQTLYRKLKHYEIS
jgi:two-component system, NtrC family, response regulator HydG